jgi:uncharacterized iron-regulated membrane protein
MAYPFGAGGRALPAYRGSRRRLRRITVRGNASVGVWALLVWLLLILFVAIPWAMRHPPEHHEHVFGAPSGPPHK